MTKWMEAYPEAEVLICPGLETKRKDIKYSQILKDGTPENEELAEELEQVR